MNAIEQQRTDLKPGDLVNPNNGHTLTAAEVAAYNRYTADLNRERHEERREFLLNQRHRFFIGCGPTEEKRSARRAIAADLIEGAKQAGSAGRFFDCVLYPGAVAQVDEGEEYAHQNAWGSYTMADMIKRGEAVALEVDRVGATVPDQIRR